MTKLLLHICCGPCSLYVIDNLKARKEDIDITGFFYNPNIHPYDELIRRAVSTKQACKIKNIPLIQNLEYNIASWRITGTTRCVECYKMRFFETAKFAKENGYTHFSSTLFVSPYQNHDFMNSIAKQAEKKYGIIFLENSDFREGFREGQKQAREFGLYRQKYCGCINSVSQNQ